MSIKGFSLNIAALEVWFPELWMHPCQRRTLCWLPWLKLHA